MPEPVQPDALEPSPGHIKRGRQARRPPSLRDSRCAPRGQAAPRNGLQRGDRRQVQEGKSLKCPEIRVERNKAGGRGNGMAREPRIRPSMRNESRTVRPRRKTGLHAGIFREEGDLGQGHEGAVDVPCLCGREGGSTHDHGVGQETQQSQHGCPAKSHLRMRLGLPVMSGTSMMLMVRVSKRQPDVQVGKIADGQWRSSWESMSSSSALLSAG